MSTNSEILQKATSILESNSKLRGINWLKSPYKARLDWLLTSAFLLPASTFSCALSGLIVCLIDNGDPFVRVGNRYCLGDKGINIQTWKVRTMVRDAQKLEDKVVEQEQLPMSELKTKKNWKDPRVLGKVGHLLRDSHIDEAPQVFEVLLGRKLLIAPRWFSLIDMKVIIEKSGQNFSVEPYATYLGYFLSGGKLGLLSLRQIFRHCKPDLETLCRLDKLHIDLASPVGDMKLIANAFLSSFYRNKQTQ